MLLTTTTPKGAATRELILDRAYAIACGSGLEGLSIGSLAQAVGMSKSGVFAHFGSREDLQLAVLDSAGQRFIEHVLHTSFKARRGLPRLHAIIAAWFDWALHKEDGGCIFLAAAAEFDDQPGPLRDRVIQHVTRWRAELARSIVLAIESGELSAETEPAQLAFELYALALVVHHDAGLFGYESAVERGMRAYGRLIDSYSSAS